MKEKLKKILSKIANIFKKIGSFIKKVFSKLIYKLRNMNLQQKIILLSSIIGFILLLAVITLFVKSKRLTSIEEIKLTEVSNNVINYIEEIDRDTETGEQTEDRYISYALEYSYNENNKSELSIDEIIDIISERFNVTLDEEKLTRVGITPYMLEKNITYDTENDVYKINKSSLTNADIAEIPIYKYEIVKMRKKNKSTYVITYDKYVISNPYEILNYYTDYNSSLTIEKYDKDGKIIETDKSQKSVDTTPILNYLTGKETIKTIKSYINSDNVLNFGKKESQVTVTYKLIDDKILLDSIE